VHLPDRTLTDCGLGLVLRPFLALTVERRIDARRALSHRHRGTANRLIQRSGPPPALAPSPDVITPEQARFETAMQARLGPPDLRAPPPADACGRTPASGDASRRQLATACTTILNASVTSLGVGCVVQHVRVPGRCFYGLSPPRGVQKRTVVGSGCCYRGRDDPNARLVRFRGPLQTLAAWVRPCGQRSGWCAISRSMSAVEGCSI
jgi:hypothetical protein